MSDGTIGEAWRAAAARLAAAGIDSARLDARLLLAAALRLSPDEVRMAEARPLDSATAKAFRAFVERRAGSREPVARILGRREFWSLAFAVSPAVLDPRPDSETLIEAALTLCPNRDAPYRALDLGTGSGCLLLSFLHERPNATGIGVDASPAALAVAAGNAARLGLAMRATFQPGNWHASQTARFDLILCNPPYVAESERPSLAPEVARYDPPAALFAGPDGLDAYRAVLPGLKDRLAPGGVGLFEIGAAQAADVAALAQAAELVVESVRRDLAGRDRCLVLRAT